MPAPKSLTQSLREEYETLFAAMQVRAAREAEIGAIAAKILANRARYQNVAQASGVPWFVVAIIHNLEASLRFDRHLHNGDPLTARTVHVPAGLPATGAPPFRWEESAVDALGLKKLGTWAPWDIAGIAFVLERYNGFGYRVRHPHVKSPYLWSFSSVYTAGKYVADGRFSDEAVSGQCGGLVLLKHLAGKDAAIAAAIGLGPAPPLDPDVSRPVPHCDWAEDGADAAGSTEPSPPRPVGPRFPGRYLLIDSSGAEVRRVQAQLRLYGCDPGTANGSFGETTELAVKLFQARSCDPAGEPLEIDGIVGPNTWAALFGPGPDGSGGPVSPTPPTGPSTLARRVIEIATAQIGVKEIPLGSNRGPRVERYLASVGLGGGNAWCMAFVHWCFDQAATETGKVNHVPRTGLVQGAWRRSKQLAAPVRVVTASEARADPSLVKPGMAFFIAWDARFGHAGLVADNVNGALETIEGNTNDDGHREGNGVFRRTRRRVDQINLGFVGYA